MSFRVEQKFRITKSDQYSIKSNLLKKGMTNLYKKRTIKSCYFDTHNLRCFYDSDEGVLPRKKIRLRWYNNDAKINKEIKISSEEGRYKIINKFHKIQFLESFQHTFYDKDYGILNPKIIIIYQREYFLLNGIRITFDTNIKYKNLMSLHEEIFKDHECVMELKADINQSLNILSGFIDIPTTRFSKYCRGIILCKRYF